MYAPAGVAVRENLNGIVDPRPVSVKPSRASTTSVLVIPLHSTAPSNHSKGNTSKRERERERVQQVCVCDACRLLTADGCCCMRRLMLVERRGSEWRMNCDESGSCHFMPSSDKTISSSITTHLAGCIFSLSLA